MSAVLYISDEELAELVCEQVAKFAYDPNEPRDDHGRWTDSADVSELRSRLVTKGGFTYNPITHEYPASGYALSILPGNELVIKGEVGEQQIADYLTHHEKLFKENPGSHVGAWLDVESGKTYLDVSIVEQDRDKAITLATQHNQEGIYDLGKGETVIVKDATKRRLSASGLSRRGYGQADSGHAQQAAQGARKEIALHLFEFDPDQPRDELGRWTDAGGGGSGGKHAEWAVADSAAAAARSQVTNGLAARAWESLNGSGQAAAREAYAKLKDTLGGKVLNVDIARELVPEYVADRTLAPEIHEAVSQFIKDKYADDLKNDPQPGEYAQVLFTAGGAGAGKSTALATTFPTAVAESQIVYDTNMAKASSAIDKIEQALAAGKDAVIPYIYRDPVEAFKNGIVSRAMHEEAKFGTGRTVPIDVFLDTYRGSRDSIEKISQKYAGNEHVVVKYIDNSRGFGNAAEVKSLSELPNHTPEEYSSFREQAVKILWEARKDGRLSDSLYRGFVAKANHSDRQARNLAGTSHALHEGNRGRAQHARSHVAYPTHRTWGTLRTFAEWDESLHPRDEMGRWTDGTGGTGTGEKSSIIEGGHDILSDQAHVDPWNADTAARLEIQYKDAKPKLEELLNSLKDTTVKLGDANEESIYENAPQVPEDWETLSVISQMVVKENWKESAYSEFYDSEVENWRDSSGPGESGGVVASDFNDGDNTYWADEAIAAWREGLDHDVPFTDEQIRDSLTVEHSGDPDDSSTRGLNIIVDTDKLLALNTDPNQPELPGIEKGGLVISEEDAQLLVKDLENAFENRATYVLEHMDPPMYLEDSSKEYANEYWEDLDDAAKYDWAYKHTNVIEDAQKEHDDYIEQYGAPALVVEEPAKYDPLQSGDDTDEYIKTQAVAKALSIERAAQLLVERGARDSLESARLWAAKIDNKLWTDWKGSSTTPGGWVLQVATAEELGGRLNVHRDGYTEDKAREWADQFATVSAGLENNGLDVVRALVRAKWETTQFMLEKAGIEEVPLYRGVNLARTEESRARLQDELDSRSVKVQVSDRPEGYDVVTHRDYTKLPELRLPRNGAASATVKPSVANGWTNAEGRVVLRMLVPRTAVLSVPAYGINVTEEREVVVAGTGWKKWDAWSRTAPKFEDVPL